MQIIPEERRVILSVGAFASFGSSTVHGASVGALWRMETGRIWHGEMQKRTEDQHANKARFEVPVSGVFQYHGWTLELNGRIDQLIEDNGYCEIREIKSTDHPLPDDPAALQDTFAHYFRQAAIYPLLFSAPEGIIIDTQVVFVNINDGITQTIPIENPRQWMDEQCARLLPFLEARVNARQRCLGISFNLPYTRLRPGQAEARTELNDTRPDTQHRIFQAPTGFGKTGIALEYALSLLQRGTIDRVVYLTGKTSGQLQACRQLSLMLENCEDPPLTLQLRNREDHHDELESIPEGPQDADTWLSIDSEIPKRFCKGFLDLETIKTFAAEYAVDPFEITRRAIAFSDVLVADYNYVFAPTVRGFLENSAGWSPEKTFLIVDESHNLPQRAQMAWSQSLSKTELELARDYLFFNNLSKKLQRELDALGSFIDSVKHDKALGETEQYALKAALDATRSAIQSEGLPWEEMPESVAACFNKLNFVGKVWEYTRMPFLIHASAEKTLSWTCLDASSEIGLSLDAFAGTLCMSATIGQPDLAIEALGISTNSRRIQWVEAAAPWRQQGYVVALDTRVDTRLKTRERSYQKTAETITALRHCAREPVVAFFSSYKYAEAIQIYLQTLSPHLRTCMQARGLNFDEQENFLLDALNQADILLLILGSSFSEGIDVLGGRVKNAIVVGPALPEMSLTQEALRAELEKSMSKEAAFERCYVVPAMQKINQALGRLVRSPEHSARIILHGKRFAEDVYRRHLDPVYTDNATNIRNSGELSTFLESAI